MQNLRQKALVIASVCALLGGVLSLPSAYARVRVSLGLLAVVPLPDVMTLRLAVAATAFVLFAVVAYRWAFQSGRSAVFLTAALGAGAVSVAVVSGGVILGHMPPWLAVSAAQIGDLALVMLVLGLAATGGVPRSLSGIALIGIALSVVGSVAGMHGGGQYTRFYITSAVGSLLVSIYFMALGVSGLRHARSVN